MIGGLLHRNAIVKKARNFKENILKDLQKNLAESIEISWLVAKFCIVLIVCSVSINICSILTHLTTQAADQNPNTLKDIYMVMLLMCDRPFFLALHITAKVSTGAVQRSIPMAKTSICQEFLYLQMIYSSFYLTISRMHLAIYELGLLAAFKPFCFSL